MKKDTQSEVAVKVEHLNNFKPEWLDRLDYEHETA